MTRSRKKLIVGICIIAAVAISVAAILWLPGAKDRGDTSDSSTPNATAHGAVRGYTPVLATAKNIQMCGDAIYFSGTKNGIFKYDTATAGVSDPCTDPLCRHRGSNASCRIDSYQRGMFFRAYPDIILYSAAILNEKSGKVTPHLYRFDPVKISNMLLDANAGSSNYYTASDRYVYFTNTVVKNDKTYFNFKQIDLANGNIRIFGEERDGAPAYTLIGAVNGKLYAADADSGATYVCSEEEPGNFTLFWGRVISYIYAGSDDIFFKSRDPEDNTPKDMADYYYHRTDYNGNIISRHKLNGGMKWGSILNGRDLYYIPSSEESVTLPDGSVRKMHPRVIYRLDTETGEETAAFSFSGDYAALSVGFGFNDLIVYDNKIYTAELTGEIFSKEADGSISSKPLSLKNGIVIIDMATSDITYITASHIKNASGDTELSVKTEIIHMER